MAAKQKKMKLPALIVYDFDGVMTDNRVLVSEDGREAVFCNRSDGMAIVWMKNAGVRQIILSSETNRVVLVRAGKLGIQALTGVSDKKAALMDFCDNNGIKLSDVLYVGNDSNDKPAMEIAGISVAPADAAAEIKKMATIVTKKTGGTGVIRELAGILGVIK